MSQAQSVIGAAPEHTQPLLDLDGVTVSFDGFRALNALSLVVAPREMRAVIGPNGAGKSSVLRAVIGHHPIHAGTIRWEGDDTGRLRPYERARNGIAYVPQGREIFPLLTVRENLETGYAVLPRAARRVTDDIFELFPVLSSMLTRCGGDLSGGQQQQLAIARALVMQPRLLLLDEPTEGIQPSIIKDIGRIIGLLAARGNLTILLVEQYFDFARELADRIVVMDRGEVIMNDRSEQLDNDTVRRHFAV